MQSFTLSQRSARVLLAVLVVVLFVGTLMPGHWKEAGTRPFAPWLDLAAASHVALFALISFVLPRARPWTLGPWHVPAVGLGLALATEGLQFFAVNRHPGLDGVAYDLLGTLIGWTLARLVAEPSRTPAPAAASATDRSTAPFRRR